MALRDLMGLIQTEKSVRSLVMSSRASEAAGMAIEEGRCAITEAAFWRDSQFSPEVQHMN